MSLPSSEPLPTNINELPPARQRHIRRQPRAASPAERAILLDSLLDQTKPTLNFFLLSILGSIIFGLSLYFNEPIGLILGLAAFPFLSPVMGLALFPYSHKVDHWIKSLISLIFPMILTFTAGVLAGYFQKTGQIDRIDVLRSDSLFWLDLIAVGLSSFLCVLILVKQGEIPRKIGLILTYEIHLPLAIAGFGFSLGIESILPGSLFLGLGHLVLAITVAIFSFLALSFGPKRLSGWILAITSSLLTIAALFGILIINYEGSSTLISSNPSPAISTKTFTSTSMKMPTPTLSPTAAQSQSAARVTSTNTATPTTKPSSTHTIAPTSTPSPQPTTFIIIIDSLNGLVIRESPDFEAPVVGYANNRESYEVLNQSISANGSLWYQVETNDGELGWLLSSLVNTQTPISTESN